MTITDASGTSVTFVASGNENRYASVVPEDAWSNVSVPGPRFLMNRNWPSRIDEVTRPPMDDPLGCVSWRMICAS
jgi:hypothetical protein